MLKIMLIKKFLKKLGVPMQIFALSCDIIAKNTEMHDFSTKFQLFFK